MRNPPRTVSRCDLQLVNSERGEITTRGAIGADKAVVNIEVTEHEREHGDLV